VSPRDGRPDPMDNEVLRCPGCRSDRVCIVSVSTTSCESNGWPAEREDAELDYFPSAVVVVECAVCAGRFELQVVTVDGRTGIWIDDSLSGA
jgi:hypothetical protein